MNPIAPVSMLSGGGGNASLVVGAVLILALIYANKSKPVPAASSK